MFSLVNSRTISYFSMLPHMKEKISMSKFMPLPIDKLNEKPRVEHPWSSLTEEELKAKFSD